jgi:PEP-CTERM motif
MDGGPGGFGGGGGFGSGGGGSGFSGGGGPNDVGFGSGGGGGGSYLASLFADQVLKAGVNSGDGSISIMAVPEPSTWAMMLAGFAGLGFLGWRESRKTTAHAA